jgi:putative phage-type endonuclease
MGLTDEQLRERRSFLGGTDLSALAGLSPYAGPIDVWRDKVEERPSREATTMMALGTLLEPVVAGLFTEATGVRTRKQTKPVRDKARPWLGGHLDRWAGDGILECKWSHGKSGWGPSSTSLTPTTPVEVPPGYAIQVQHYLGVTGRQVGYLAVLLGYADFRWYAIARDDETIADLRELGDRFWHDNVLAGVPPEPDGTESYGRFLAEKYRADAGIEVVGTVAQQAWAQALRGAARQRKEQEAIEATHRQRLMDSMGTAAKMILPFGSITWRTYTQRSIAWDGVARDLAGWYLGKGEAGSPDPSDDEIEAVLSERAEQHTTIDTRRPFKPVFKEDDDAE